MRGRVPDVMEKARIREPGLYFPGEWFGKFLLPPVNGESLFLIVGHGTVTDWPFDGPPWDHVSVSVQRPGERQAGRHFCAGRCPTWEEMCRVKDLCFEPEECVVQFHPPRSEYVNDHEYVLHLWRPVGVELPRPPALAVGTGRKLPVAEG